MLFYQRPPSEAFLYLRMVSCAHAPHAPPPMDLKIYRLERNPLSDSTADKFLRLWPKLSLRIPLQYYKYENRTTKGGAFS